MKKSANKNNILKTLLIVAALFVVLAGLKVAANILVPFLLSSFIAIICYPLVKKVESFKVPKPLAIVGVVLVVVTVAVFMVSLVGKSLLELSQMLPRYLETLRGEINWVVDKLAAFNIVISRELVAEYVNPSVAMKLVADTLSSLGDVMVRLFLVIITVVFMLFEASSLPKKIYAALEDPEVKIQQAERFFASVNNYLAIKVLVSAATGISVTLMLWVVGLDFYLLWGVLAFLLNFIPNIGSIIAAIPAILLAALQFGLAPAGFIGVGYLAINVVMANFIEPRYLGRGLGLSTLVVFLSLVFWGWLLGGVGMLLSVLLTMVIKIGLENSEDGKWIATLLSGDVEDSK
ncbi:MAG: AI-2E family transporter [Gammaproteobacteria bacterium]|nr:AI-2E family transporter [Gammaproteobacteria bacterium]